MTRLAVLADIHGNLPALQAVIDDMNQFDVDHVVVAGDSVNWGTLFARSTGARLPPTLGAYSRQQCLSMRSTTIPHAPRIFGRVSAYRRYFAPSTARFGWLNAISCLPDTLSLRFVDAPPLRVFHGVPDNPWQAIFPCSKIDEVADWLGSVNEGTVICAHSHIPMERHINRWHIFNPGSVGVPLDGDFSASYMILDGHTKDWELAAYRRVPFDYDPLYREFDRQNFVLRGGVTASLVVEEFRTASLQVHPYIHWKLRHFGDRPDNRDLLREFLELEECWRIYARRISQPERLPPPRLSDSDVLK